LILKLSTSTLWKAFFPFFFFKHGKAALTLKVRLTRACENGRAQSKNCANGGRGLSSLSLRIPFWIHFPLLQQKHFSWSHFCAIAQAKE
jgi:hypothetical protein